MPTTNDSQALGFGATSMSGAPVGYGKSRVAGNGAAHAPSAVSDPGVSAAVGNNPVVGAFKRQACSTMTLPIGPRTPSGGPCLHAFTFEEFQPTDDESLQVAIKALYRQVLGNCGPMESERSPEVEERLLNGDFTVRECVRRLAKSPFYRSRYFDVVNQQRAIELNIKHILGRAPHSQAEVVAHVELMANDGFEAHIDSLVDSAEYEEVFGADTVPYNRTAESPAGISTSFFNRGAALYQSFAGSDNARGRESQLLNGLARGTGQVINIPIQLFKSGSGPSGAANANILVGGFSQRRVVTKGAGNTPARGDLYVGFGLAQREQEIFERCPGDSPDQIAALIRSCYRQVMGNPHMMDSERCTSAESKFEEGYLSTREFVRALANSAEYRRRFFEPNAIYRFVELNFKHLLGRAPVSQAEVAEHIRLLADEGYEAEISSYLDSEEYQSNYGENTVPFVRISTENRAGTLGSSQLAFNRHLSLVQGYAGSDTVQNGSTLVDSVATNSVPGGWTDTTNRINRRSATSGSVDPTTKRFRIVVTAQPKGGRQRVPNASYLVSGKDMTSQMRYIHRRGGRIASITEVV